MAQPDACPTCGTAAEPDQEYCLACGSRIVPARRLSAVGDAWERRFGRYPGDWAVAAAPAPARRRGVGGRRHRRQHGHGRRKRRCDDRRHLPGRRRSPASAPQTQPATTAPPPSPAPKPQPRPEAAGAASSRPGRRATATRSSSPRSRPGARGSRRPARRRRKRSAAASPVVGVLLSGGFSSLHPGYYVSSPASTDHSTRLRRSRTRSRRSIRTPTPARSPTEEVVFAGKGPYVSESRQHGRTL